MGTGTSSLRQCRENESLARFVSLEPISENHPFWNGFLSFQSSLIPMGYEDSKKLEEIIEPLAKRFILNNLKTGNFGILLDLFLKKKTELIASQHLESSVFLLQTCNNLFVLRTCMKFFIERIKDEDLEAQFEAQSESSENVNQRFELLFQSLIDTILDIPLSKSTYTLHTEATLSLLIMLSSTLYSSQPAIHYRSYKLIMSSPKAMALIRSLLTRFMDRMEMTERNESGSLVVGIASGVFNMFSSAFYDSSAQESSDKKVTKTPLADFSLLLLLVLVNQCTPAMMGNTEEIESKYKNPFRSALFRLRGIQGDSNEALSEDVKEEQFDFAKLFKSIWSTLDSDESTLLLYLLLHQNDCFRIHVLASSDMDLLVIPLLKTLYRAPTKTSGNHHINHHVYMSLIILLILSEDDLFNTSVHETMIKNIEWYSERSLTDISLGGTLILVVIRTIQFNMLKMRDKYLHTNCLAALANMSSQFRRLHSYVCQRIISMFETLAKKHGRIMSSVQYADDESEDDESIGDTMADAEVLEEVLKMILEIINSCLVHQIKNNPNLIYTLLYKRDLFAPFASHPSFQDLTQNIQTVINYFGSKLDQTQEKKGTALTVDEVQEIICHTVIQFPKEKLIKFPDLKFKYVEEEKPEDFFIPYIWSLIMGKLYWNPAYITHLHQKE
nr:dymeclin-like isoform X2 [Lepeophtheirus salmonis]